MTLLDYMQILRPFISTHLFAGVGGGNSVLLFLVVTRVKHMELGLNKINKTFIKNYLQGRSLSIKKCEWDGPYK